MPSPGQAKQVQAQQAQQMFANFQMYRDIRKANPVESAILWPREMVLYAAVQCGNQPVDVMVTGRPFEVRPR